MQGMGYAGGVETWSIKLPAALAERIEAVAAQRGEPRSTTMRRLLEEGLSGGGSRGVLSKASTALQLAKRLRAEIGLRVDRDPRDESLLGLVEAVRRLQRIENGSERRRQLAQAKREELLLAKERGEVVSLPDVRFWFRHLVTWWLQRLRRIEFGVEADLLSLGLSSEQVAAARAIVSSALRHAWSDFRAELKRMFAAQRVARSG